MSSEALKAFEDFILEDPRASELKPHLVGTLWLMAYKCGSTDPFVYFQGDELLATLLRVSTKQIRTNRKDLEGRKILVTIQEHAHRSRNKRIRLCLLPEEKKGGSTLPPLDTLEVEVEPTKGRSNGGSPTPERWKPASSKKRENKKIESNGEQFFNELMLQLPNYFSSIKYASNLKELFNDLAANHKPEVVAYYIRRKKLGQSNNFIFVPFVKALEEYLEDPRKPVEDYEKYLQHKQTQEEELSPKEDYLAPDKLAELMSADREKVFKQINQQS